MCVCVGVFVSCACYSVSTIMVKKNGFHEQGEDSTSVLGNVTTLNACLMVKI